MSLLPRIEAAYAFPVFGPNVPCVGYLPICIWLIRALATKSTPSKVSAHYATRDFMIHSLIPIPQVIETGTKLLAALGYKLDKKQKPPFFDCKHCA